MCFDFIVWNNNKKNLYICLYTHTAHLSTYSPNTLIDKKN